MTIVTGHDPDDELAKALAELQFIKRLGEIVFSFGDVLDRMEKSEQREALATAERAVSRWEARRQELSVKCRNAAACNDRRCRRSKSCKALRWMSGKAEVARVHLAALQAKWPAPSAPAPEIASGTPAGKRKRRTGVRP